MLRTDISNVAYHSSPELSRSVASDLVTKCPAKVKHDLDHPTPSDAPHFVMGGCTHTATLEPWKLEDEYAAKPDLIDGNGPRTNAYKASLQAMQDQAPDKRWLPRSDYNTCLEMAESARENPVMKEFLSDPESIIEGTGLFLHHKAECKVRPDLFNEGAGVLDLKTTQSASEREFSRSVIKFNYHFQAYWYLHGLRLMGYDPKQFLFVCVEKAPPYLTAVYTLSTSDVARQASRMEEACRLWVKCNKTGEWPGYPSGVRTLNLGGGLSNRLSVSAISEKFKVSRSYVYRLISDYSIEEVKLGNKNTLDMNEFASAVRRDNEGRAA